MVKLNSFRARLGSVVFLCGAIALTCFLVQVLVTAVGLPLKLTAHRGPGQILLYVIVVAGVWIFARYAQKQVRLPTLLGYVQERPRVVRGFLLTVLPTCAATLIGYAFFLLAGVLTWSPDAWQHMNAVDWVRTIGALAVVVLLAATEELIFRGFLFNYLCGEEAGGDKAAASAIPGRRLGAAVVGSAILFALVHHFRDPQAWLEPKNAGLFVGLFLLGVLLAMTYRLTGSLACSIGVHSGLLWPEVFRSESRLLELHQGVWWAGVNKDIRTAPVTWVLFVLLMVGVWYCRVGLRRKAVVETGKESENARTRALTRAAA